MLRAFIAHTTGPRRRRTMDARSSSPGREGSRARRGARRRDRRPRRLGPGARPQPAGITPGSDASCRNRGSSEGGPARRRLAPGRRDPVCHARAVRDVRGGMRERAGIPDRLRLSRSESGLRGNARQRCDGLAPQSPLPGRRGRSGSRVGGDPATIFPGETGEVTPSWVPSLAELRLRVIGGPGSGGGLGDASPRLDVQICRRIPGDARSASERSGAKFGMGDASPRLLRSPLSELMGGGMTRVV